MIQRSVCFRPARLALLAALFWVGSTAPAGAGLPILGKVDAALTKILAEPLASLTHVRVIVTAKPGLLGSLLLTLRLGGYTILAEHPSIEAVTLDVPRLLVPTLTLLNLVQSISLDAPTRALWSVDTTPAERLSGALGSNGSKYTGAGVGVAVMDSGIHPAPDFQGRITAFYDFSTTGKPVARTPSDAYGHGTHVAGLIGGSAAPSSGFYAGVAPGVRLVGLKVLDGNGSGYTSHVISAIEFATTNQAALGIHVINLSLGHPIYEKAATDPLVKAVEFAVRRGLIVVVSAGNYGTSSQTGQIANGGIASPGNAPSAITVGALNTRDSITRADDVVAPYSSRGPTWYDGFSKPDLVAPGHALVAAMGVNSKLWAGYPALRADAVGTGSYMRLSGTSMAAAVATGVVALVLESHRTSQAPAPPPLTPNAVKAVLQFTGLAVASPEGTAVASDALTQGAGSINAGGATELARRLDTRTNVGDWWLTAGVEPLSVIDGQALVWSQHLVWGGHLVWGDTVYSNQHAFQSAVTWDSHIVWGDHLVWGDNTVWDFDCTWDSHIVWGDTWIGRNDGQHIVWGDTNFDENTVAWGSIATSKSAAANPLAATGSQP